MILCGGQMSEQPASMTPGDHGDYTVTSHKPRIVARNGAAGVAKTRQNAPRFTLIPFDDLKVGTQPRYLVKGIIPRESLVVVWGPPKCGKSFWIFDLAMHIALGREYRGRRVHQGGVVYCAFEGQAGIRSRAEAFRKEFPTEGSVPFYLEPVTLDLVADHKELIATIKGQTIAPVLVVLDTLNRSLRGEENNSRDMSAYIAASDAIREAFNCTVAIVHHCGIDEKRPRGSTALTGAVDAQLSVKRDVSDAIIVEVEYMKDGAVGDIVASRLRVVDVGTDEDGETISSCVIEPAEPAEVRTTAPSRRLPDRAKLGLRCLTETVLAHGKLASHPDMPSGAKTVTLSEWREELFRQNVLKSDASNPRADFARIQDQLAARDLIGIRNDVVWLV
jgi:hypothetical protein